MWNNGCRVGVTVLMKCSQQMMGVLWVWLTNCCHKLLQVVTRWFRQVLGYESRSQWPRSLRRRSAAPHLLRSWVRIPRGAWMFVCCECCVFSGRGLCDELITRPEESYWLWCVVMCDLETSRMRRPWPALGRSATGEGGGEQQQQHLGMRSVQNVWSEKWRVETDQVGE